MADEEGVDGPNYVDFRPNRRYLTESTFVRETFLSERLGEAIGMRMVADRKEFSWVTPHHHGVVGWKHRLVENRQLGWHPSMSPVPITVKQKDELCIPYQIYNLLRFQINLIVRLSPEPVDVPEVPLQYLVHTFLAMPKDDRTFTNFLKVLHIDGFPTSQGYDAAARIVLPNANRLFIHWCKGFGHSGRSDLDFELALKYSVVHHGGVLAEMYTTPGVLDPTGLRQSEKRVYVKLQRSTYVRMEGHALLILGWKVKETRETRQTRPTREVVFLYLNTHGKDWGLPPYDKSKIAGYGFVKSVNIHHVYVPQLCKW